MSCLYGLLPIFLVCYWSVLKQSLKATHTVQNSVLWNMTHL